MRGQGDEANLVLRGLIEDAPLLKDHLDDESRAHFDRLQAYLHDVGIGFKLNPRLVRGLDYYTRTVFEWVTSELGAQGAVCSGGRYDGLVAQLGGRETPAVGWALGVERVIELARADGWQEAAVTPDVYLVSVGEAALLAGLPRAPSAFSPFTNPSRAKQRQIYVLKRMNENGFITQEQMMEAISKPVRIFPLKDPNLEFAPYLVEHIRRYLVEEYGEAAVYQSASRSLNQAMAATSSGVRNALPPGNARCGIFA